MNRVAISRAISRRLLGLDVMLCAVADQRRLWIRHPLNYLFRWRDRDHCAASADYEARQEREPDPTDYWRSNGWL